MFDSIFKVFYLIGFAVGSAIRVRYSSQQKDDKIMDDRKTKLDTLLFIIPAMGMIIIPLLYVLTPWFDFADYHLPTWAGWLGAAVFAAALCLLWRSHADLGRNWSGTPQIKEGQSLVTRGVYRYIRHPMYAAHWLWGIAQTLLLQNWVAGFAMLASFVPGYLLRVTREELMMLEHFGAEYRSYMNRTGRIFPRLWRHAAPS